MGPEIWVVLLGGAALVSMTLIWRETVDAFREAIDRFRGGGGGPRPMHPSPVNDAPLLRKRARR